MLPTKFSFLLKGFLGWVGHICSTRYISSLKFKGGKDFCNMCMHLCLFVQLFCLIGMNSCLQINLAYPHENEDIQLPTRIKAIKDLRVSPCGRLTLLASLGKKLSVLR